MYDKDKVGKVSTAVVVVLSISVTRTKMKEILYLRGENLSNGWTHKSQMNTKNQFSLLDDAC